MRWSNNRRLIVSAFSPSAEIVGPLEKQNSLYIRYQLRYDSVRFAVCSRTKQMAISS